MNGDNVTTETQLSDLQKKFDETHAALVETRRSLETVERRQRIDQLLVEADAVDLEAARLLTEAAVAVMDEPDVKLAVEELRGRKPCLFRKRHASGGAMSPKPRHDPAPASDAAKQAATSGDRRDLLRYLRMRRKPA